MVFNDSSTYLGIVNDIDYILFGSSTATSPYAIADKTRNINNAYDKVVSLILQADGRWEWDDNNKTDLPIGTTSLVANQQDYEMSAATFLKILKVEIKDSSGNWKVIKPISLDDKRNISITEYKSTAGTPEEYDKLGNSIFLFPKPSYASSGGLKIFYQRNVTHFAADDTTDVPGFAENFHRLLSYGAAFDYAVAHQMTGKISILKPLITEMERDLIKFYSTRGRDEKMSISLQEENYGDGTEGYFDGVTFT